MAEIEMGIDSTRESLIPNYRAVILKEKEGERYLSLFIGSFEVEAITVKLLGVAVPRPLTHDFTCAVINALGGNVKSVVITKLENDIFYAKTCLEYHGEITEIDCRPTDAIAMAIRTGAPIFADEKVLNEAGLLLPEINRLPPAVL